jgi:uncharacterized protein (DUF952 family)
VIFIYHIATRADWEQARRDGEYTTSTIGRTLAEEGFIHASQSSQVADVANRYYRGIRDELVVLVIDPGRVRAEIRYEHVPGTGADPFPHIYGPLNADAVLAARPFSPATDGTFSFPPAAATSSRCPASPAVPIVTEMPLALKVWPVAGGQTFRANGKQPVTGWPARCNGQERPARTPCCAVTPPTRAG